MKNILFRINELSKEKATGLTVDEKQEQQMLRQNYTETFRGSLDSILLNTKLLIKMVLTLHLLHYKMLKYV